MGSAATSPAQLAPAVRFPLARSGWLLTAILALAACSLAVMCGTWSAGQMPRLLQALGFLVLWSAGLVAGLILWWKHPVKGWLEWSGVEWALQDATDPPRIYSTESISVALDLQAAFLLRVQPMSGGGFWLWLERKHAPSAWRPLRRAIKASARISRGSAVSKGGRFSA